MIMGKEEREKEEEREGICSLNLYAPLLIPK